MQFWTRSPEAVYYLEGKGAGWVQELAHRKLKICSAVDQILAFNRRFPRGQLQGKLEKMTAPHLTFFRATFHLFASDLSEGWCRDWPLADVEGQSSALCGRRQGDGEETE